ncbi:MAG: DUF3017 domain-containing protein [Nocardioidaceae bacterium]|nr:DUF3017 domain-containing protein [Nocardioidaceae bacterium]MCL2612423.1 DUF3017 domain-containing protein [Nocardioidaceae bacterium]
MTDDHAPEPPEGPAYDEQGDELEPRRYPSTIGGAFYIGVLVVAVLGVVLIGVGVDWRVGIRVLACALGVGGLSRLVLPQRDAGMLAVRARWLDVAVMLVVGVALFVLSITIPDQPV